VVELSSAMVFGSKLLWYQAWPVIHKAENVSSAEHYGVVADNRTHIGKDSTTPLTSSGRLTTKNRLSCQGGGANCRVPLIENKLEYEHAGRG